MSTQSFNDISTQLLVLGNRFDMKCGLNSNYFTFLEYVLSKKHTELLGDSKVPDLSVLDQVEAKLEERLTSFSTEALIRNFEISEPSITKMNVWYMVFLFEKINRDAKWADIESVIQKYVIDLKFADILVDATFLKLFKREYRDPNVSIEPELKSFAELVIYYLVNRDDENKIIEQFQEQLREISDDLLSVKEKYIHIFINIYEKHYSKIREVLILILYSMLNELEKDFQQFMKYRINDAGESYKVLTEDLFNKLMECNVRVNIYSFNYTRPWIYLKDDKRFGRGFNVHGDLTGLSSKECYPIFGIDKGDIDPNSLEYRFTKEYRTFELYMTTDYAADNEGIFPDKNYIDAIKFYGNSLAEADYSYFQHLFDYYDLYNNNQLKLIFYYSVYDDIKKEEIQQEQMTNILRLLDAYGATMDNSYHGKNLSTHLIQTGRLKLEVI